MSIKNEEDRRVTVTQDLIPTVDEMNTYHTIAKTAYQSAFFGKLGGESGILSIMLMARELGLPPMQAIMGGMNNIQGKIELSARLMNSMIRKRGHKIEVLICTKEKCVLKGTRCDTGESLEVEFSVQDAKQAGSFKNGGPWEKYPDDMCFKSALSKLARRLFADVISTAYVEGEIDRNETDFRSSPPVQEEKASKEEIVIQPFSAVNELITTEEAQEIENMIPRSSAEYRTRLLSWAQVSDFFSLPRSKLPNVLKSIEKHMEEKRKQDLAPPPVAEQVEF